MKTAKVYDQDNFPDFFSSKYEKRREATVTRPPGTPQPREFDCTMPDNREQVKEAMIAALVPFIFHVIDAIYEEKKQ